jgi:hypothetical protein
MKQYALVLAGLLAAAAPASLVAAAPLGRAEPTTRPAGGKPAIGLVRLDVAKRQAWFEAEICLRAGALEFLVCARDTKTHESILHTKARASHLHAALLVLGLRPGKPARWSGDDEAARFLPPAGAKLRIDVAWKDKKGTDHCVDATTWLTSSDTKKPFDAPKHWVFVGSEVLPDGRYWAEIDGDVISLTNFASAVVDVPFQSSNVDELRDILANTAAIPPLRTKVRVIVTALPGGERAPHARALLEIDPLGRMRIDGERITPDKLETWAAKFLDRHERGMVVIRAAGRALVHDVEHARQQLRLGGIRQFAFQRVPPPIDLLPRTAEQAKRDLARWNHDFANAHELIRDPAQQARRTLEYAHLTLRRMAARQALLKEYAAHLEAATKRYQASTQPAKGDAAGARE